MYSFLSGPGSFRDPLVSMQIVYNLYIVVKKKGARKGERKKIIVAGEILIYTETIVMILKTINIMKPCLLLFIILVSMCFLFSCASTTGEEGGAAMDGGLEGDGENPFASPSSLTESVLVGGISMMLPPGSHVTRTKEGDKLVIQDEGGEEIGLLYEIVKFQGLTAKTAAEFMKRSIRSGEEESIKELSFGFHGFPSYGIVLEERESLIIFMDLKSRIQVCELYGEYTGIIPYIRITDRPVSYRHRRNFLFTSLNSFWRWYSDFHEGAILYKRDSFGGLFAAVTASDGAVDNPFPLEGTSSSPQYTGKTRYSINHNQVPMDYELFLKGEEAVLSLRTDFTEPPVYAFFYLPSIQGTAAEEIAETQVFLDLFLLHVKMNRASGVASAGPSAPLTIREVR